MAALRLEGAEVAAARALLATLREEQAAADAERREAAGALQQLLASRLAEVEI